MKTLLATIALLFAATTSMAQEVPPAKTMLVRGGILCDTQAKLEQLLTEISLNNGQFPEDLPETCGQFMPEQPVPMIITPKAWYETPMAKVLVAHFLYVPNGWQQWGYVAFIPNPDWKPSEPA